MKEREKKKGRGPEARCVSYVNHQQLLTFKAVKYRAKNLLKCRRAVKKNQQTGIIRGNNILLLTEIKQASKHLKQFQFSLEKINKSPFNHPVLVLCKTSAKFEPHSLGKAKV